MSDLKLLIENALIHKEAIEPSLRSSIVNRDHYNAKNSLYPETIGRGNYLQEITDANFNGVLNRMKRSHDVSDINPNKYFEIKKSVGNLLLDIAKYEEPKKAQLNSLAETIIRDYFSVPNNIQFEFDTTEDDLTSPTGQNVIESFKDGYEDFKFEDYSGVEQANQKVDRARMNYCLICGGSNQAMKQYKSYEDALDSIDYRLGNMYNKYNAFNDFNIWVTPDELLMKDMDKAGTFKIHSSGGEDYNIAIEASNFLSTLYEMSKAVLSILFQEKYNNPHVDYENPWNTRVGAMAWQKLIGCATKKSSFPYVVDAMNQLEDKDYSYVMKEVLAGTNHSKQIFQELYDTF